MATRYLVTKEAVDAILEGMEELRWGPTELGRHMKPARTRQAVNQALNRIGGRSEFLLDMLIAVGKPRELAFALTDPQQQLVKSLGPHIEDLDPAVLTEILPKLEEHLEALLALREKKKTR